MPALRFIFSSSCRGDSGSRGARGLRAASAVVAASLAAATMVATTATGTLLDAPAAHAQVILPGAATTTSAPTPATTSTTAAPAPVRPNPATQAPAAPAPAAMKPATTTTTKKGAAAGVPAIPVGGPPTTVAPAGAKPAPMPDPTAILLQVDSDIQQLQAISDVKLAQDFVSKAETVVAEAGAALLTARQNLAAAQAAQAAAHSAQDHAASRLRQLAIDAYVGVGYTTPGIDPTGGAVGTQATPAGISGIDATDAQEMLILVGQHARQSVERASTQVTAAVRAVKAADVAYQKRVATVSAAQTHLISARQTLDVVTTAATTPGAAAATPVSQLMAAEQSGRALTVADLPTASRVASPPILGPSELNAFQLAAWWSTSSRKPNLTVPIDDLIASYAKWGTRLDVDFAVAFAQSIVETGSFSFPSYGQLTAKDNNFAGIGACDSCAHGWSFPTADAGVLAQLELLHEFATTAPWPKDIPNAIGGSGIGGCCATWTQLAGKWASSTTYGISIMTIYHQMLTWLIPEAEVNAGLIAPTPAAAQGPDLAPLPKGAKQPATPPATTASGLTAASAKGR